MKNWKIITIVTGLFVALATVGAVRFSANTIPLEAQVKMEAGLPADANIPNYKYQALLKEHQLREDALKVPPASKPAKVQIQDAGPVGQGPTGILGHVEGNFGMIPSAELDFGNSWIGNVNGLKTIVYAGSEDKELGNPMQSIIWIMTDSGAPVSYKTSSLDGGLTITAVNGNVLTLKSEAGSAYTFDIATRSLKIQ